MKQVEGPQVLLVAATGHELGRWAGVSLGVGPVVAAAEMAWALATVRPSAVVLVGTAGRYESAPLEPEVVQARRLGWAHAATVLGAGYVPAPPPTLEADFQLRERIGVPEMDVLTVGAITTSPRVAEAFGRDWQIEHMEAYGAAVACRRANVPFACVLGITNQVGPEAHTQWRDQHRRVEALVADVIGACGIGVPRDS